MINISQKFISTLKVYDGLIGPLNTEYLNIEFPVFSILFHLKNETVSISDLMAFENWHLVKSNFKKKEIQSIIDKYYNAYNNLKAFY